MFFIKIASKEHSALSRTFLSSIGFQQSSPQERVSRTVDKRCDIVSVVRVRTRLTAVSVWLRRGPNSLKSLFPTGGNSGCVGFSEQVVFIHF